VRLVVAREKVTTFPAGLNLSIGLMPVHDVVLVYSIPKVYRLSDNDGDGKECGSSCVHAVPARFAAGGFRQPSGAPVGLRSLLRRLRFSPPVSCVGCRPALPSLHAPGTSLRRPRGVISRLSDRTAPLGGAA
jgi:hypothetical protein